MGCCPTLACSRSTPAAMAFASVKNNVGNWLRNGGLAPSSMVEPGADWRASNLRCSLLADSSWAYEQAGLYSPIGIACAGLNFLGGTADR